MATTPSRRLGHDQRAHAGAGRSLGWAVTSVLAAVTALGLIALALTLFGPLLPVASRTAAAQTTLVRRFYAAANARLAGSDAAGLAALLAPGFRAHEPDGPVLDGAGFGERLAAIARAAPGLQLQPAAIIASDGWATARVGIGGQSVGSGAPITPPLAGESLDRFQFQGAQIVGYWPGAALRDLPQALPPLPLGVWTAPSPVTLARLLYAPGAGRAGLVAPGPQLLLLESGQLAVRLAGAASWFAAAHPAAGWQTTLPSGQDLLLNPGDAVFVPAGVTQTQRNRSAEPALALSLAMFPPIPPLAAVARAPSPSAPVALDSPAWQGLGTAGTIGVWVDVLATGFGGTEGGRCLAAPLALTVTRLTLAPGATLPTHAVTGVTLVARDDPWLVGELPAVRAGTPTALDGAPEMGERGLGSAGGQVGGLRNLSPQPLPLVLFTAAPADGAACRDRAWATATPRTQLATSANAPLPNWTRTSIASATAAGLVYSASAGH